MGVRHNGRRVSFTSAHKSQPIAQMGQAGVFALTLGVGLVFAISLNTLRPQTLQSALDRATLKDKITEHTERAESLAQQNAQLQELITAQQQEIAAAQGREILTPEVLALGGSQRIAGAGVRYTLSAQRQIAKPGEQEAAGSDRGVVLDRDLQVLTNAMWLAGAEGIAINGHRLTSTSAIRSAGQAILVDYRPLAAPYVVEAIGDPAAFRGAFQIRAVNAYLQKLTDEHGISIRVKDMDRIELPAGTMRPLQYAALLDETPATKNDTELKSDDKNNQNEGAAP